MAGHMVPKGIDLSGPYPTSPSEDFIQYGFPKKQLFIQMNKYPQRVICPSCKTEQAS